MDPSSRKLRASSEATEVPLNSAPERRRRSSSSSSSREARGGGQIRRDNNSNNSLNGLASSSYEKKLNDRSRRLTWCFIALVASITCIWPWLSLHLTQRVGLLLYESDIIQMRASLFNVIICLIILVILYAVIFLHLKFSKSSSSSYRKHINHKRLRGGLLLQRLLKQLIGLLAITSAISYLSLALLVPHIKQIQRMPLATFDCNANLITIENCQQQFTTRGGEQSLLEALGQLLFGYGSAATGSGGHSGNRLIKKFHCFQYQDEELGKPKVPTRFLLHHCGLVCRPQRQQLHQFSDDLNREQQQNSWSTQPEVADERGKARLIPPYHHAVKDGMVDQVESEAGPDDGTHLVYRNATSGQSSDNHHHYRRRQQQQEVPRQVSLRVCFSSDFSSGSSYKQFCITNLAANSGGSDHHGGQGDGRTLTVGQLNAMLRKSAPIQHSTAPDNNEPLGPTQTGREDIVDGYEKSDSDEPLIRTRSKSKLVVVEDQTTHYVNPIVQFESHFKNWPHLSTSATSSGFSGGTTSTSADGDGDDNNGGWCKFRPIPPFIVNNKPFNDIQCSLEHEYTMTTSSPSLFSPGATSDESFGGDKDRIYLKKSPSITTDGGQLDGDSTSSGDGGSGFTRDRCNIQCKVNILYKIQASKSRATNQRASFDQTGGGHLQQQHFYSPLKPCIIVRRDGDKLQTSNYYLLFRSLGDSTLVMAFILLDLYLLLEAIDSGKSQFESKKYRLTGILLVLTLTPLTLALLFDLISIYSPAHSAGPTRKDNYLSTFLFDRLLPSLMDLFYSRPSSSTSNNNNNNQIKRKQSSSDGQNLTANATQSSLFNQENTLMGLGDSSGSILDNFTLPFFVYSILMFILAINSWTLPLVTSTAPLIRASSAEELGMSNVVGSNCSIHSMKPHGRQPVKQSTGSTSKLNNNDNSKPEMAQGHSRGHNPDKQTIKLISFLLIAVFMGIQFNLSLHVQVQIFVETFGNPVGQTGGGGDDDFTVTWFVLGTHSTAAIFVLSLVLILANETSTFFSNSFALFKLTPKSPPNGDADDAEQRIKSNKFLKYISLTQIIYSLRYFGLLSLNPASRFKWVMVFLIQVAGIFNFPIVWFALTSRVHELIAEHPAYSRSARPDGEDPASGSIALNVHIVAQSSLALIYYALSRYLALFVHSLYLSLHLHSDNIDWFINSFYHQRPMMKMGSPTTFSPKTNNGTKMADGRQEDMADMPEDRVSESLFSPLPSERQTYLYASRLFLKYNSILCLIIGSCLLLNRLYAHYQVWSGAQMLQKQRKKSHNGSKVNEDTSSSQQIDERLSLDLMRIHDQSNGTTSTIYPPRKPPVVLGGRDTEQEVDWRNPRAKILFHYNLGHKDSSDESLSSRTELNGGTDGPLASPNDSHDQRDELRIPIALAEEEVDDNDDASEEERDWSRPSPSPSPSPVVVDENLTRHGATGSEGQVLERVVKHRSKRVRIFEDDEEWPVEIPPDVASKQEAVGPTTSKRLYASGSGVVKVRPNDRRPTRVANIPSNSRVDQKHRRRTITFAPTATLIGHDGTSGRQLDVREITRDMGDEQAHPHPHHASPEPSLDSDDQGEEEGESVGIN